jgi:hypothetical protein
VEEVMKEAAVVDESLEYGTADVHRAAAVYDSYGGFAAYEASDVYVSEAAAEASAYTPVEQQARSILAAVHKDRDSGNNWCDSGNDRRDSGNIRRDPTDDAESDETSVVSDVDPATPRDSGSLDLASLRGSREKALSLGDSDDDDDDRMQSPPRANCRVNGEFEFSDPLSPISLSPLTPSHPLHRRSSTVIFTSPPPPPYNSPLPYNSASKYEDQTDDDRVYADLQVGSLKVP